MDPPVSNDDLLMKHFVFRREITSWCEEQHHHYVDEVAIVIPNDVNFVAILKRSQVLYYSTKNKVWRTEHTYGAPCLNPALNSSKVLNRVDQIGHIEQRYFIARKQKSY
jgi:hypothetical protein